MLTERRGGAPGRPRDLESQIVVVTASPALQRQLTGERDRLLRRGTLVDAGRFQRDDFRRIPGWVRLASRLGRAFL